MEDKHNQTKTEMKILDTVDQIEVGFLCIYAAEFAIKVFTINCTQL